MRAWRKPTTPPTKSAPAQPSAGRLTFSPAPARHPLLPPPRANTSPAVAMPARRAGPAPPRGTATPRTSQPRRRMPGRARLQRAAPHRSPSRAVLNPSPTPGRWIQAQSWLPGAAKCTAPRRRACHPRPRSRAGGEGTHSASGRRRTGCLHPVPRRRAGTVAWIAADRFVETARRVGDPLLIAVVARCLAHVLTHTGRSRDALAVTRGAIDNLAPAWTRRRPRACPSGAPCSSPLR
jgi:hypothetical protein